MKYSSHSTYYNKKGVEVVSATSVLKILNKPSLSKWANFLGFKRQNIDQVLKESSEKGTLIHEAINCYIFNKIFIYVPKDEYEKYMLKQTLDKFITWYKNADFKPIFGEKQMSCEKFGGTVDLYCELDGKKTILDFKSSKAFYSTMFLQLAGYTYMMEQNGYEVDQVCIMLINENYCRTKIISRDQLDEYINTFLLLVELYYKVYEINLEWKDLLDIK